MTKYLVILLITNYIAFGKLVINEIMPAPISPEPEWIELFNNSDKTETFDTLYIADPSKISRLYNFSLDAFSFCVISSDTIKLKNARDIPSNARLYQLSLPTFNNTTDYCKIYSSTLLVDSLFYDMSWGANGKSFERVNPDEPVVDGDNLTFSIDSTGATPGKKNSEKFEQINDKTYFKINEIMYDVSSNNAEYIELYNYSNDTTNLKFCKIADASGKGILINKDIYVFPQGYFVIFWDTLIFKKFPNLLDSINLYFSDEKITLNNDEDVITIKNYKDSTIDSVTYNNKWHNTGLDYTKDVSLEKVREDLESANSSSWNSSTNINGGTPCEKNSYDNRQSAEGNLSISPNPFSLSKSGDKITVEFQTPFKSSKVNIRIFDVKGHLVSHPINNQFLGQSARIEINPIDKNNIKLPPEPYIIMIESMDTESGSINEQKALFVIAE